MKTLTKIRSTISYACVSALFTLTACAPVAPDTAHAGTPSNPSAFADALSPPGGVPCRLKRPVYTALQRRLGIHGSVRVTYVVNTAGRIDLAIVDKSSGNQELDNAAREAVEQGTCAPYVVNGVAHRVVQNTTFNFEHKPEIDAVRRGTGAPVVDPASATPPGQQPPRAGDAELADRAEPAIATSSAALASPASSTAAPLSLADAIQAAMLKKLGIAPDSPKAALIKHWGERMRNDPDVSRFFGSGPNHATVLSLSPPMQAEFLAEGVLRLSAADRSKLVEYSLKALDNAPPDCGGVKNPALVTSRYMPLAAMSDADVDAYFGMTFSMLKQSALQTPLAQVTEEQRAEAQRAVAKTLTDMLKNDAEGTRDVAAAVADPTGVSAEVWCKNVRLFDRALLATPQPFRDWSIVAAGTDAKARLASLRQLGTLGAALPGAPSAQAFATLVQRRVRPNIIWSGPTLDLETAVAVRCAPTGTLLSATISRSSGNAAWDMAALRAVQRSDPMPLDASGRTPPAFVIVLRPMG